MHSSHGSPILLLLISMKVHSDNFCLTVLSQLPGVLGSQVRINWSLRGSVNVFANLLGQLILQSVFKSSGPSVFVCSHTKSLGQMIFFDFLIFSRNSDFLLPSFCSHIEGVFAISHELDGS